ncbi:hypothetical protein ACN2T2_003013 [Listeria monocytogenes]|nr:hypothetical protein [Listeria monocytogenes]EAE8031229.1 hypothetical protein [Listeria monocytogenes]EAE8492051.1 hypothetical protein [Listeria monocytogenes]EAE9317849.1 hypothetical protein [Listeria monocytogenes]EAF2184350.1 hypothetical protein [Listeria monocytogenes]
MKFKKEQCAYCEGEMTARIKGLETYKPLIVGYDSYTFIEFKSNRLTTVDNNGAVSQFITFCPMCARDLLSK